MLVDGDAEGLCWLASAARQLAIGDLNLVASRDLRFVEIHQGLVLVDHATGHQYLDQLSDVTVMASTGEYGDLVAATRWESVVQDADSRSSVTEILER